MYEVGTEVVVIKEPVSEDYYTTDQIKRGVGKKGRTGVVIQTGRFNIPTNTGMIGINKYLLSLDGQRMWWYEASLAPYAYVKQPEKDIDEYFLPKTRVRLKQNPTHFYYVKIVKPKNSPKANTDYYLYDEYIGDYYDARHDELEEVPEAELAGYKNPTISKLPNPFKSFNYPLAYITPTIYTDSGLISPENMLRRCFAFVLSETDDKNKTYAKREKGKLVIIDEPCKLEYPSNIKDWKKQAILSLLTVKIKDTTRSIKLFGNKNKKMNMLEDSKKGKTFNITNITENYITLKTGETVNVFEINNGEISLKFVEEDIEFVFPCFKGYNKPKNRTISVGSQCVIRDNRHLNIKRGERVTVIKINNLYQPFKNKAYSKNTPLLVSKDDGKLIRCKIKNLKKK